MPHHYPRLHHLSLIVAETATAVDFYCGLLGLELAPDRPPLGFPGAWLQLGEQQIHLLELPNPDPRRGRPEHGGRDRHLALQVSPLDHYRQQLEARAIPYTLSRSGRQALFCRDPDGNGVELIESAPVITPDPNAIKLVIAKGCPLPD
ncbi:MAG: VOC family protein [Gammaproteobacteria bacterium]|nr:VOC family protein [Gammaproteobacteria bacterium]